MGLVAVSNQFFKLILKGTERLQERPIKDLVTALVSMGADINYVEKDGSVPLNIMGRELNGGVIDISGSVSSQFISSLLLIAPIIPNGLKINITGNIVSRSYIMMTLSLMSHFGIDYLWEDNSIIIPEQDYVAKDYIVERDWSCASGTTDDNWTSFRWWHTHLGSRIEA